MFRGNKPAKHVVMEIFQKQQVKKLVVFLYILCYNIKYNEKCGFLYPKGRELWHLEK